MPSPLPDNVPEVGSIRISIGMEEHAMGMGFALDGISDAEAIGHLEVLREVLKQRQASKFLAVDDDDDTFYVKAFHVTCPECGEPVTYAPEELFEGAEYADDDEDED